MIERREFALAQPLNHCENGRINEANVSVGIAITKIANPWEVRRLEVFDSERSDQDVI